MEIPFALPPSPIAHIDNQQRHPGGLRLLVFFPLNCARELDFVRNRKRFGHNFTQGQISVREDSCFARNLHVPAIPTQIARIRFWCTLHRVPLFCMTFAL
jgi:hypothetical protein